MALFLSLILPSSTITSVAIIMSLFMLAAQGVILIIGIALVGDYWQVLKAILVAPLFLIWKFVIDFVSMTGIYRGKRWIRAERHVPDKELKKAQE